MKKTKIFVAAVIALVATAGTSCKKELQDINTNPNQLNESRPEFLFTSATLNYGFPGRGQMTVRYGGVMTYMQYIVADGATKDGMEGSYWTPGRTTGPSPNFSYYDDYFASYGRDLNRIIALIDQYDSATQQSYASIKAICQIIDTYSSWKVADVYGALPYTQAFQTQQFPLPAYDLDFNLYKAFDAKLKAASALLKAPPANQVSLARQDLFYGGDLNKWIRFANTLRIKIAQRYEKRDPANLAAVLNDIASNFEGALISSNDQSFGYDNLRDWNNNVDDIASVFVSYVAAYPFVEFLKSTNDPRIAFMVRENDFGTNYGKYRDIRAGGTAQTQEILNRPENQIRYWGKHVFSASLDAAYGWFGTARGQSFTMQTGPSQTINFQSNIQTRLFVKNGGFGAFNLQDLTQLHDDESRVDGATIKMRSPFITYADVCFMMAEIAIKGGNALGKSAAQWYTDGVTASFDFYKDYATKTNVPGAANVSLGTFLSRYPFNGTLAQIYSQAWVNNLIVPEEAWATWKRTGYPQFVDFRAGQSSPIGDGSGIAYLENLFTGSVNQVIPRRMALPTPQTQNLGNFNTAVEAMKTKDAAYGESVADTKGRIWWDAQ